MRSFGHVVYSGATIIMRDMRRQPQLPLKTAKGSLLARPMVVILVVNVAVALAHALLDTAVLLPGNNIMPTLR